MNALPPHYQFMSPTLLSEEPPTLAQDSRKMDATWAYVFSYLETRLGRLRAWRWGYWAHWSRIAEWFLPRRFQWLVVANRFWRGTPINDQIIDSTPGLALKTCAAGMWSGLTNPARRWISLGVHSFTKWEDLQPEWQEWISGTAEQLYAVLAQSNFYQAMALMFRDLAAFGTAPLIAYEHFERVVNFFLPAAGEFYLAMGAHLTNDTIYREFAYTVQQIVEFAGLENCPDPVVRLWTEAVYDTEFVVCHAIEPNTQIASKAKRDVGITIVPGKFTWRELYWCRGILARGPLSKRGFNERPFGAFLWEKSESSNDPYGFSPCMECLGDAGQLQSEQRSKGEFIQKLVGPPMGADQSLKNEPASIIPRSITYMNTGQGGEKKFFPLFEMKPEGLNPLVQDIAAVAKRLERGLFVDVFMAITQMEGVQPRNELELSKRDLERLQKLGPVIELVDNELRIVIERVLAIMGRRGMLKPMPASMKAHGMKIEFIGLMRIAQKQERSLKYKAYLKNMGEVSTAAKAAGVPDPLRKLKLDKFAEIIAELDDIEPDLLYTDQEVLAHDKARADATQKQQQPAVTKQAVDAAKALSQTDLGGDSALSAMLGKKQPLGPGVPV